MATKKEEIIEAAKETAKKVATKVAQKAVEVAEAALDAAAEVTAQVQTAAAEAVKEATTPIITPEMAKIPAGPLELKWTNYKNHQKLVNPANKRRLDVIVIGTIFATLTVGLFMIVVLYFLGVNIGTMCA